MFLKKELKIGGLVILSTWLFACGPKQNQALEYTAIHKRDTAHLRLTFFDKRFHGKMHISRPGNVVDSGIVEGNIHVDSLIGNFYYRPYGAKFKKRRAFALLNKKDSLIQGSGLESVYMGIPYYLPNSISFDSATYIFHLNPLALKNK